MSLAAVSIWKWSLTILPFTVIITLIVALFTDRLVYNHDKNGRTFFEIPVSYISSTDIYFLIIIVLLILQILAIIIGRFQLLLRTQSILNRISLFIIHISVRIPLVYFFLAVILRRNDHFNVCQMGIYGIFASMTLYCFLHTILIFYLYICRSYAPQYATISWPIWFLICILLIIIFYIIWILSHNHKGCSRSSDAISKISCFITYWNWIFLKLLGITKGH
jgi:hypothetical protein